MKKIINVIQNTHWDYEWYFTNEQSTVLFEFFMSELLESFDSNKIDYFILDGQMGILEKYLESFPENKEKIKKLNEEGKLSIGPWFTQTDQMIISSESIVKNLLIGDKIAKELGGAWKMAYVPDAFGQSSNMPKIYNGFNIDKMVFWRGLSDKKCSQKEFIWKSDDNSRVTALNIPEGYYAGGAIYWGSKEYLENLLKKISEKSHVKNMNVISLGGDQRYVDLDIKNKLDSLNSESEEYEFKLGNYENYFNQFEKEIPIISGELLDSQASKIHRSIYSHRYDHKQMNDYAERLLTQTLEPLVALAAKAGIETHLNLIENAWKLLLLNSAHDSAGACNSDITNEHITNRFKKAIEITESYIDIIIRKISETAYSNNELILFNTNILMKSDWIDIEVITKNEFFEIWDNGIKIDFDIIETIKEYYGSINRDEKDNDPELYYYKHKIMFSAKVPPLSYRSIKINEINKSHEISLNENNKTIENEFISITYENNELNIYDKRKSERISNLIELISDADDGDTYDFSPLKDSFREVIKIKDSKVNIVSGKKYSKMFITGVISLIENLDEWAKDIPKRKKQKISIEITLVGDAIRFKLNTVNKSKDHRLRLRINSKIDFKEVKSDIHYGFISREIIQEEINYWKEMNWNEEPTGIYPVLSNLIIEDKNKSMNLFLEGIKEYEAFENKSIELTLYRSIGFLGKPNLIRRPGKASGQEFKYVETPDSQLIDKNLCWEFTVNFSKLTDASIRRLQKKYSTKNTYYQIQELDRFTGPLKYFVSNKWKEKIEKNISLFEKIIIDKDIEVSILKQISEDETLIRIVNHSNEVIKNPLILEDEGITKVYKSNLLEERLREVTPQGKSMSVDDIESKKVDTYIIKRG